MKSKGTEHLCSDVAWSINIHWQDEGTEENFLQATQKKLWQMGMSEVVWTNPKDLPKVSHSDLKISFGLYSQFSVSQIKSHPDIGHISAFCIHLSTEGP